MARFATRNLLSKSLNEVIAFECPTESGLVSLSDYLTGHPGVYIKESPFEIVPGAQVLFIPIAVGDITTFVPKPLSSVPPDPGPAGNETVAGIDTDGNEVRDDVQRYIEFRYVAKPEVRPAAFSFARALQKALTYSTDPATVYAASQAKRIAVACFAGIVGSRTEAAYEAKNITLESLNTMPRLQAFYQAQVHMAEWESGVDNAIAAPLDYCSRLQ